MVSLNESAIILKKSLGFIEVKGKRENGTRNTENEYGGYPVSLPPFSILNSPFSTLITSALDPGQ